MTEVPATEAPATVAPPVGSPRSLRRRAHGRVLGGVAAGLAEYFDIDVVLVRVAFVVLAVFGGSSLLLYVVGWVLIPGERGEGGPSSDGGPGGPPRHNRFVFVAFAALAALALADLVSSGPWWPHWGWGAVPGFWLFFAALAFLALLVLRHPSDSAAARARRVLLATAVAVVALVVVSIASVFTAEAVTGVPLRGGVGASHWQPDTAAQVAPQYRLALGQLMVDLRSVAFPSGTTHVTASVGIGQLVVEVPAGPAVSVSARSGMGNVSVFGDDNGGVGATRSVDEQATGTTPGARIVLDAQAGIGQVRVVRGP